MLLQQVAASLQEGCYAPTVDFLGKCYYNRRCVDMLMRSSSDVTEAFVGLLWAAVQNAETRALHYAEVVASTRAQQPKKGGGRKRRYDNMLSGASNFTQKQYMTSVG